MAAPGKVAKGLERGGGAGGERIGECMVEWWENVQCFEGWKKVLETTELHLGWSSWETGLPLHIQCPDTGCQGWMSDDCTDETGQATGS